MHSGNIRTRYPDRGCISSGSTNVTSNGTSFNNIRLGTASAGGSVTLLDNLNITGNLTAANGGATLFNMTNRTVDFGGNVDLTNLDGPRSVSRRHAKIIRPNGEFQVIEEIGTMNGTFVNGTRIVTGQPVPIKDGDRIRFGLVDLTFRISKA